jgi:hypothetical protein
LRYTETVVAATKNVDVAATHDSGSLTTYTVKETSGKDQPAGTVYIAGQAFRRGDLPPGTYPVFRDPKTKIPFPVQQLDEIATRRENGDDGSIRHLVFSVQLPAIPANGTYTMEIVRQTGTYSATAKQSLAALARRMTLSCISPMSAIRTAASEGPVA